MSTDEMRAKLIARYPGSSSWENKVKKMSDQQVFAIWNRINSK